MIKFSTFLPLTTMCHLSAFLINFQVIFISNSFLIALGFFILLILALPIFVYHMIKFYPASGEWVLEEHLLTYLHDSF